MVRILIILIMICSSGVVALGQSSVTAAPERKECTAAFAEKLSVRGFHLGMNIDEVLDKFAGSRGDPDMVQRVARSKTPEAYGAVGLDFSSPRYLADKRYEGVNDFSFSFIDGELVSIGVSYDGPEWLDVDQFIAKLSLAFGLPDSAYWLPHGSDSGYKHLVCGNITIAASSGGGGRFGLYDLSKSKIVGERKEAAKEKRRQAFKP